MEADFSGYATKAGLKCSDGRTIMPDAFAHQDKATVPLVWQHSHNDPKNVLGHAVLENRKDGVYAYAFFNGTPEAQHVKTLVQHGDVVSLSIYANQLKERSKQVFHGMIRELSVVLSGANPGALIDNVRLVHSDGESDLLEDEAVIFTGLSLQHEDLPDEGEEPEEEENKEAEEQSEVKHEDKSGDETVADIYDSMTDKQKEVVQLMVGAAVEAKAEAAADDNVEHSDSNTSEDEPSDDSNTEGDLEHKEGTDTMSRNVFDQNESGETAGNVLTHDQFAAIVADVKKHDGSLKESILAHADEYGITDIELLFPDAKVMGQPELKARRNEWVDKVLSATKHSPFAKVKSIVFDITAEEARAKGYTKGTRKKEEVIKALRRTTSPATIYKKQKLDRDDVLDITDMDVVAFLKAEIRLMLEEEIARAILVGDGRDALSEDKIKDPEGSNDGTGIRSILNDDPLYSIKYPLAANVSPKDAVKGLVRARAQYRGTGKPTLFVSDNFLTDIMLEEDRFGRPLYETEQSLADKLRVKEIVTVDLFDDTATLLAIMVNLQDYTVGANKGGELTSFEDFDIDYNQHKYLQETRLSGGLTKPFSAVVVTREQGVLATAAAPSFDGVTNTITIPTAEGVVYQIDGAAVTGDVVITEDTEVVAVADEGYYLAPNTTNSWSFTYTAA
jgi:HK97 family phage prohead protease